MERKIFLTIVLFALLISSTAFNTTKLTTVMKQLYFEASCGLGNWHWTKFGTQRIGIKVSGNIPLDYVYLQRSLRTKNPRCPKTGELLEVINAIPHDYEYDEAYFWTYKTGGWCRLYAWLKP